MLYRRRRRRLLGGVVMAACLVGVTIGASAQPARATSYSHHGTALPGHAMASHALSSTALTPFLGFWQAHSIEIGVATTGYVVLDGRAYRECGPGIPLPCDVMVGNSIISGVHIVAHITSIQGKVAHAIVLATTVPREDGGAITFTFVPPAHLLVQGKAAWWSSVTLCNVAYFNQPAHRGQVNCGA